MEKIIRQLNQIQSPEELLQLTESMEENFEIPYDSGIANLQLFAYLLNWDIVNARFLYYKYKNIFDIDPLSKEFVRVTKLIFENKNTELLRMLDQLCDQLDKISLYKKWTNIFKNEVKTRLHNNIAKNFSVVNVNRFNMQNKQYDSNNGQQKSFSQVKQEQIKNEPLDVEKLTKVAKMIQNIK